MFCGNLRTALAEGIEAAEASSKRFALPRTQRYFHLAMTSGAANAEHIQEPADSSTGCGARFARRSLVGLSFLSS